MTYQTIRRFLVTIAAVLVVVVGFGRSQQATAASAAPAAPTASLLAHWELEGNVNDSSGNDYHGTVLTAVISAEKADAAPGTRSYEFSGGQYIDSVAFDINNDFTIAAWINPDAVDNRAIIGKHTSTGGNQVLLGLYGGYQLNLQNETFTGGTSQTGWQHILVVGTETTNGTFVEFFRNGIKLWENEFGTKVGDLSGGLAWTIGQDWDGGGPTRTDYFDGNIDDVRIYDGAMSEAEIAAFTAGFANVCTVAAGESVADAYADPSCEVISVAAGTYNISDIFVERPLIIEGEGQQQTTFEVVSPASNIRGIRNTGDNPLTIRNLKITGADNAAWGGAVYNGANAVLNLENVTFDNNHAQRGGAIFSDGTLVASNVTFTNNSAPDGGGAIGMRSGSDWLGRAEITDGNFANNDDRAFVAFQISDSFDKKSEIEISNSIFENNADGALSFSYAKSVEISGTQVTSATTWYGISFGETETATISNSSIHDNANGGIFASHSNLSVLDSTISDNSSDFGGGIQSSDTELLIERSLIRNNTASGAGGGVYHGYSGTATIRNSTIANNTADDRGGGIFTIEADLDIAFSTIVDNEADFGMGAGISAQGDLDVSHVILDNPDDGGDCEYRPWLSHVVTSGGYNILATTLCGETPETTDQLNTDALLGLLDDNGGATMTFMPQPDSPAIDAGGIDCDGTDQRGIVRPNGLLVNGIPVPTSHCDIGAVELTDGEPVSDEIAQQRLVKYQNYASISDPLVASCDTLPSRMAGIPMAGYQAPDKPILHHSPGYRAHVAPGEQTFIRSTDSSGRATAVEGTLYDDPLRGNYGLVNLDLPVAAWMDSGQLNMETVRANDTASTTLAATPSTILGSRVAVGTTSGSYQFDVATGDLNGDVRAEEIMAWRPTEFSANPPIHIRIGGLPGETELLASEPVARYFNNKLYLFARGYDDALWIGVDTGEVWQWQRCGGTLASGPAVLALSESTLETVAVGTTGKLYLRTLSTGGSTDWAEIAIQPDVTFEGTPALAKGSGGMRHLLARDSNNTVWHAIITPGGYGNWQNLGGYLADDVAAIGYDDGRVAMLVRGFDNALWYRLFDGSVWGDWATVTNPNDFALASTPALLLTGAGSFDAYARTADDGLAMISFSGGSFAAWQTVAVEQTVASRPAVAHDGTQTIVYAARPDSGVLQRSDAAAPWSLVRATAPGAVTVNTGLLPEEAESRVKIESGHFLADGREQLVLAYANASSQVELRLYAINGGFAISETASLVLPTVLEGTKDFDITVGDFDGDGSAEIAALVVGGQSLIGQSHIIDWNEDTQSLETSNPLDFESGNTAIRLNRVSITAGDFTGTGKDEIGVGYSTDTTNGASRATIVRLIDVDDTSFAMTFGDFHSYTNIDTSPSPNLHVQVAAGDVTGTDADGVKRDEFVTLVSQPADNRNSELRVFSIDEQNELSLLPGTTQRTINSNNRPIALAVADMDRDLIDEIAVLRWLNSGAGNKDLRTFQVNPNAAQWEVENIGTHLYPATDGAEHTLALAAGDVTGESLRVGAPRYRLQENVTNIIAIINAMPTHVDSVDSTLFQVATGGNGEGVARYFVQQSNLSVTSVEETRSFDISAEISTTFGDPEGTHATDSLGASYGVDFSVGREALAEYTIETEITANTEDRVIYRATSYQMWEYPVFVDNSGEPATHISIVFPVPTSSNAPIQGTAGSCNGWYQPTHEVNNMWSYPTLGATDSLIGFPANGQTMAPIGDIQGGTSLSRWFVNMTNVTQTDRSGATRVGITTGLERQIGGDTVDVSVELPIVGGPSVSKSITTPSLKASINGSYSSSSLATTSTTLGEEIEFEGQYEGINIGKDFTVRSYLYRADGGYVVLDHTVNVPNSETLWSVYDAADPAFRRPWAVDNRCPGESDFSPEIVISPAYAERGQLVNIAATVHNYSNVQAPVVTVDFYLGDPASGGSLIGSAQTDGPVNRVSSQTVSIDWQAEGSGEQRIYAVIDPDNNLAEVHDEVSNFDNLNVAGVDTLSNNNKAYGLLAMAVTDFVDVGSAETYYPLEYGIASAGRAASDQLTYSAHLALEALEETLQFELTSVETEHNALPGHEYVDAPFELRAWDAGVELTASEAFTSGTEIAPSVIKVTYPASINDADVVIKHWDTTTGIWVDVDCNQRSTIQVASDNLFVVPVCETGQFAVFVDSNSVPAAVTLAAQGFAPAHNPLHVIALLMILVGGLTVGLLRRNK